VASAVEFASSILDTAAFFLVSPDLLGKYRVMRASLNITTILLKVLRPVLAAHDYCRQSTGWRAWIVTGTVLIALTIIMYAYWIFTMLQYEIEMGPRPSLTMVQDVSVSVVLLFCAISALLFVLFWLAKAIARYSFNGMLLRIAIISFLVARGLSLYEAWPF
jgi:hypothetical protein